MDLISNILEEFNLSEDDLISSSFISDNEDLMWIKADINLILYVPSYMVWCIKNKNISDSLIFDYTINAISEYGRCKDESNNYLNFKYQCTPEQIIIIVQFLDWCLNNLMFCDKLQIKRSIKHWK